ncbi:MAG: hypothetical protein LBU50_02410, partial [Cellulomonas sp.]|nr:hypothetical protein [Cellulomonas sp.]
AQAGESSELSSCLTGTWDLDAGFLNEVLLDSTRASLQRKGLDGTVSGSRFSAVQTATFAPDGTFSVRMPLSMGMTMSFQGRDIPVTFDATSTGTGTWTVGTDTFSTTTESSDLEQLMTRDGEPLDGSLDPVILLPDTPTPVVCNASTLTVPFDTDDADPFAPEALIFTRQR